MLLEIALRNKDVRHIFLCNGTSGRNFDAELDTIATSVGPEILVARQYPISEWATIWRGLGQTERIAVFHEWLGMDPNRGALFLVDDIDTLSAADEENSVLSLRVNAILYTGRNPNAFPLIAKIENDVQELAMDETILLMRNIVRQSSLSFQRIKPSDADLTAIAHSLHGHPLAACNAVTFIAQTLAHIPGQSPAHQFIEMTSSTDWELRKEFLVFKPHSGSSIMDNFELSMRWKGEDASLTSRVLQIAAFLNSGSLDFRDFLHIQRPWMADLAEDVPNHSLFGIARSHLASCVRNLRSSSALLYRPDTDKLEIHPIWLECLRQRVGDPGRRRILRQVVLLIRVSLARREHMDLMEQFLDNCKQIAQSFRMNVHDLAPSSPICRQLAKLQKSTAFMESQESILHCCRNLEDTLARHDRSESKEWYAGYLSQIIPLLHRFSELEINHAWNEESEAVRRKHLETYDAFAKIARPNAILIDRLSRRRSAYSRRWKLSREIGM